MLPLGHQQIHNQQSQRRTYTKYHQDTGYCSLEIMTIEHFAAGGPLYTKSLSWEQVQLAIFRILILGFDKLESTAQIIIQIIERLISIHSLSSLSMCTVGQLLSGTSRGDWYLATKGGHVSEINVKDAIGWTHRFKMHSQHLSSVSFSISTWILYTI